MMNIKLSETNEMEKVAMRDAYRETMMELAENNRNIVVLDADLMSAMGMKPFQKKFPGQTVDCGVQEQNMYGVAAGLSREGKIPFAHTFAPFATRRACDQIFVSCAYAKLNVKVIGSDPGITAALNGGTHMPFEDLGIMRGIPEMTVIEPTDTAMIRDIVKQIAGTYGMHYLRLVRKSSNQVFEAGSTFEIGKAAKVRDGKDVTIIATGYCVNESIKAAKMLEAKGISARILNMFTIKPIDKEAIIAAAEETGAIVTAENHNIYNGLGSAVAEVLVENKPTPMQRVGVKDLFGEVGPVGYLAKRFNLTADDIVLACENVLARKKG